MKMSIKDFKVGQVVCLVQYMHNYNAYEGIKPAIYSAIVDDIYENIISVRLVGLRKNFKSIESYEFDADNNFRQIGMEYVPKFNMCRFPDYELFLDFNQWQQYVEWCERYNKVRYHFDMLCAPDHNCSDRFNEKYLDLETLNSIIDIIDKSKQRGVENEIKK